MTLTLTLQVCTELEAAQLMAFQAEQENTKHTLEMAVISATLEMRTAERNELEALLKNPQIDDSKEKELAVQLQAAGVCVHVCVCRERVEGVERAGRTSLRIRVASVQAVRTRLHAAPQQHNDRE